MNCIKNRLLLAATILSALAATDVRGDIFTTAGVDLGAAGRTKNWAVFSLSGVDFSGSGTAIGDVGVGGGGKAKLSGGALIQGDLYYRTNGSLDSSGGAKITGVTHHDAAANTLLDQGVMDAMNAANFAAGLATTPPFTSTTQINLSGNNNLTLTGNGKTVLNLQTFQLSGSSTLTLTGTAGTAFVINVSSQFSLSGSSSIVLSGGLTAADVLINVTGTGGSKVEMSGSSMMTGILMAAKRDVNLSGSAMVFGEVIGNTVTLSGSAKVTQQVSPARNR
jgi:hypothetical protein